jgi:hypothetical protein
MLNTVSGREVGMRKPHEDMTDEELVDEWKETHVDNLGIEPGQEPPAHAYEYSVRHEHAAAELERRGYAYHDEDGWYISI